MKKGLLTLLVLSLGMGLLCGKCINPKHQRIRGGTKKYTCSVKNSEVNNFDNGYCKNCGCHSSDHDNL